MQGKKISQILNILLQDFYILFCFYHLIHIIIMWKQCSEEIPHEVINLATSDFISTMSSFVHYNQCSFIDSVKGSDGSENMERTPEQKVKRKYEKKKERVDTPKQLALKQCRENPNKKTGHWSVEQKEKYFEFLLQYRANFEKKELRRSDKIFKIMSQYLGTRAPDQCRSHHQKMQKKYFTFQNILASSEQILKCPPSPQKNTDVESPLNDSECYQIRLLNPQSASIPKDYFFQQRDSQNLFNERKQQKSEHISLLPVQIMEQQTYINNSNIKYSSFDLNYFDL